MNLNLKNRTATLLHHGTQLTGTITKDYGVDDDGLHYIIFTVTGIPTNNSGMVEIGETFGVDVSSHSNLTINPVTP